MEEIGAECEMISGICQLIRADPEVFEDPLLLTLEDSDSVCGAAIRTPPQRLILGELADGGAPLMASWLAERSEELPGVFGPSRATQPFVEAWERETKTNVRCDMQQRCLACRKIIPARACEGAMRRARQDDVPVLAGWRKQFVKDIGTDDPLDESESVIRKALENECLFVWEVGDNIVSMVGTGRSTQDGISVTQVYTPAELRGNGYASACTAEVTHLYLASGKKSCTLFTDLANPASNRIYEAIGYQPVSDFQLWTFSL